MEGVELATLDRELLLEIVQNLSYREILQWCRSTPNFLNLCQNDPLFYDGILRTKLLEEGLANIFVDINKYGKYRIDIDMLQDKVSLSLTELTPTLLSNLLNTANLWEESVPGPHLYFPYILPNGVRLGYQEDSIYGPGRIVRIETRHMNYIVPVSDLKNILLVASEMIDNKYILSGEIEGHVVLLLDGTTEFIAH